MAVVQFLEFAAPPGLLWLATTNQKGTRSGFEQGILTAMGMVPGAHDLIFAIPPSASLRTIELKSAKGVLSDDQKAFGRRVIAAGGEWRVCRTLESVEIVLRAWGVQLRATVLPSGVFQRTAN